MASQISHASSKAQSPGATPTAGVEGATRARDRPIRSGVRVARYDLVYNLDDIVIVGR